MTENEKTEAVKNCKSFTDLATVIQKHAPFISNSGGETIKWQAKTLMVLISSVIMEGDLSGVPITHGLRSKVKELLQL